MVDETLSFMARLKRHHIYRVATVYAIAAWILIQLSNSIIPNLGWPRQSVLILIVAVALLFPVVLVVGWMFIPPSKEDPAKYSRWHKLRWRLGSVLSVVIIVLVTYSGVLLWRANARHMQAEQAITLANALPSALAPAVATVIPAKSVAVLPFENLSPDKNNAYFAAGMQDIILTKLASIGGIKVIARTSTAKYSSYPEDLKPIGEQLGVATVLEGSVQKAGNHVLIDVQLIDAQNNSHIWAESYERTLSNIFGVENEVARMVAAALQASLTTTQIQHLAAQSTTNIAAYDAYLRGLAKKAADEGDAAALQQAADSYSLAVQLDPRFALAWARLAGVESQIYSYYDHTQQRLQLATHAIYKARALAPDRGETQLALGNYYYYGQNDHPRARIAYERAIEQLPNNAEALAELGYLMRKQGKWTQTIEQEQQAVALDPLNIALLEQFAATYGALGRYTEALNLVNRGLVVNPDSPDLLIYKAAFYESQGDMPHAAQVLAGITIPPTNPGNFLMAVQHQFYKRDYAAAIQMLQTMLARPQPGLYLQQGVFGQQLGFAEQLAGHPDAATSAYHRARDAIKARLKKDPGNPLVYAWLGLTEAGLGHKGAALAAGRKAVALVSASSDAFYGPGYDEILARIEMQVGERHQAIDAIRHLLSVPYSSSFYGGRITIALLQLDPEWDPLRTDPAFHALLREYSQSTQARATATL